MFEVRELHGFDEKTLIRIIEEALRKAGRSEVAIAVEGYARDNRSPTAEGALDLANQYQPKGRVTLQSFLVMRKQSPEETVVAFLKRVEHQPVIFSKHQG